MYEGEKEGRGRELIKKRKKLKGETEGMKKEK